jgi:hypothetical protein
MDKFSIIIPTMWIPTIFLESINEYLKSSYVDEIIIIDNNPNFRPKLPENDKIKLITKGHNIFVNPAWNWGVKVSKNENLIIANDDLFFSDVEDVLHNLNNCDYDLVGLHYKNLNSGNGILITPIEGDMESGFGCFLFLKKHNYFEIPENFKIWYGDRILFNNNSKIGVISLDNVKITLSETIKSSDDFSKITETERINSKIFFKKKI